MNFTKKDDSTWEVDEGGCIFGFVTKEPPDISDLNNSETVFFDFKAGANPSLTLSEMQELVKFMEEIS